MVRSQMENLYRITNLIYSHSIKNCYDQLIIQTCLIKSINLKLKMYSHFTKLINFEK